MSSPIAARIEAHLAATDRFGHGMLIRVIGLMPAGQGLWADPAMGGPSGFVRTQRRPYSADRSPGLLVLSGFDLMMIGLVLQEYWVLIYPRAQGQPRT